MKYTLAAAAVIVFAAWAWLFHVILSTRRMDRKRNIDKEMRDAARRRNEEET